MVDDGEAKNRLIPLAISVNATHWELQYLNVKGFSIERCKVFPSLSLNGFHSLFYCSTLLAL